MTKDSMTMLLIGLILGVLLTGLYLISSQVRLIQYTTLKMQLDNQQMIVEALLPLTCPIDEKKAVIKK
jgi:uncharacterized membrane protein YciS (DUF1049 family)